MLLLDERFLDAVTSMLESEIAVKGLRLRDQRFDSSRLRFALGARLPILDGRMRRLVNRSFALSAEH